MERVGKRKREEDAFKQDALDTFQKVQKERDFLKTQYTNVLRAFSKIADNGSYEYEFPDDVLCDVQRVVEEYKLENCDDYPNCFESDE